MDGFAFNAAMLAADVSLSEDERTDDDTRPGLVAEWHVAPDGRLACRWRIDCQTGPERSR